MLASWQVTLWAMAEAEALILKGYLLAGPNYHQVTVRGRWALEKLKAGLEEPTALALAEHLQVMIDMDIYRLPEGCTS